MSELIVNHASRLNELHRSIFSHAKKSLAEAIEAGRLLIEQKVAVKGAGGKWLEWIKENVEFGHDTATRYMRLHERRDEITHCAKSVTAAYRLLAGQDNDSAEAQIKGRVKETAEDNPTSESETPLDQPPPESAQDSVEEPTEEPEPKGDIIHRVSKSGRHTSSRATVVLASLEDTLIHMGTQYTNAACKEIDDSATDEEDRRRLIVVLLKDLDRLRWRIENHFSPKPETAPGQTEAVSQ